MHRIRLPSILQAVCNQGLDALMIALQKWNGGVIVISHDERFITTVAKEVREPETPSFTSSDMRLYSSGYAEMELLLNSEETSKATR